MYSFPQSFSLDAEGYGDSVLTEYLPRITEGAYYHVYEGLELLDTMRTSSPDTYDVDAIHNMIWGGAYSDVSRVPDTNPNRYPGSTKLRKLTPLWLVCRQLYTETRRLFYSDPVFSFANFAVMNSFLKKLAPLQRAAITNLDVSWSGRMAYELEDSMPVITKLLSERFGGLKVIYISKNVYGLELIRECWEANGVEVVVY